MSTRWLSLLTIVCGFSGPVALASCPDLVSGDSGEARWAWDQIYVYYDGSYSFSAVNGATALWSMAQSVIDLEKYNGTYEDVLAHAEDIGELLGEELNHGQNEDPVASIRMTNARDA